MTKNEKMKKDGKEVIHIYYIYMCIYEEREAQKEKENISHFLIFFALT